jgi:hypothetical protein
MNNDTYREEYFGCSCSGMNHVVRLNYFVPDPKCPDPDIDNIGFLTCVSQQWRDKWVNFPYDIAHFFSVDYWKYFWHGTIWSRIPIAVRYVFRSKEINSYSVLDAMNFQEKDFDRLFFFLSQITDDCKDCDENTVHWLKGNDRWDLRFEFEEISTDWRWAPEFGIDVQFKNRKFFGRLWHSIKYLFNCNGNEEIDFEIQPEDAAVIKGMIKWHRQEQEEIERRKNEEIRSNTE